MTGSGNGNPGAIQLPPGWVWTTIGRIYDIVGGGTPSTKVPEYWAGDIPWITSADILGLKDVRPRKRITQEAVNQSATHIVPKGSLIVVTRVGLGKVAIAESRLCFSQDAQALVSTSDSIVPEYALYYLWMAVERFKYENRGTTISGVTKKQLSELPFPLAPYDEQRRVVEKIEELISRTESGMKSLQNASSLLKENAVLDMAEVFEGRLVRSLLWQAYQGKLVPHDPQDEPADRLLLKIDAERAGRTLDSKKTRVRSLSDGRM